MKRTEKKPKVVEPIPGGVRTAGTLFVVLCKGGDPHPGTAPQTDYESAAKIALDLENQPCSPHRPQAYRPMT